MFSDKLFIFSYENVIAVFKNITILNLWLNKSFQSLCAASYRASEWSLMSYAFNSKENWEQSLKSTTWLGLEHEQHSLNVRFRAQ